MKRLIKFLGTVAAAAVLWFTGPAEAQVTYVNGVGQLLTTGDRVVYNIAGTQRASARFAFPTGTSQTLEFDYSIDGVNWIASGQGAPYVKCISGGCTTPGVTTAFGSTATVGGNSLTFNLNTAGGASGSTWELPLGGNVQSVSVKALSTITTPNLVTIYDGLPYAPGVPVTATLFDVTSVANTAINTNNSPIFDMEGWTYAVVTFTTPVGGAAQAFSIDDSGVDDLGAGNATVLIGASALLKVYFGTGAGTNFSTGSESGQGAFFGGPLGRRMAFLSSAVAGLTSRIRIEVRR